MTRTPVTADPNRNQATQRCEGTQERSPAGSDPAPVAQATTGRIRRAPAILAAPLARHDTLTHDLPLRTPPEQRNGGPPTSVSPGRLHRATPRRAPPGPNLNAGTPLPGNRAAEPSRSPACTRGPGLAFTVWGEGRSVVVSVSGDVDVATSAQLSEALSAALCAGAERLVCDLTDVGFLDAPGVQALLIAGHRAIGCYAWLDLVCTQSQAGKVIRLSGPDTVMPCHDSVAEAVDAQERRCGRPGLTHLDGGD